MKTTETINGKKVTIDWEFTCPIENHDSNWCEWSVTGNDEDGNQYSGTCHADATLPENDHDIEINYLEQL